jgi:hypothetical protein
MHCANLQAKSFTMYWYEFNERWMRIKNLRFHDNPRGFTTHLTSVNSRIIGSLMGLRARTWLIVIKVACILMIHEANKIRSLNDTCRLLLLLDIYLWILRFPFSKKPKARLSWVQKLKIEITSVNPQNSLVHFLKI